MKNILIAAFIFFLFASVLAQTKMNDRELDGYKGKVESVIIEKAEIIEKDGQAIEEPRRIIEEKYYDKGGKMSKMLDNALREIRIYTFIDGDKTYKAIKTEPPLFRQKEKSVNQPDERYNYKFKYKYDAKGRVIEEQSYTNTGAEAGKSAFGYDAKGRLIKVSVYIKGNLLFTEIYKLDAKGVELESIFGAGSGETENQILRCVYNDYQFDAQGNWIKRTGTVTSKRQGKTVADKTVYHRKIKYYEN